MRFRLQAVLQVQASVKVIFYRTLHSSCRRTVVPYAWLKFRFKNLQNKLLSDQNTIKMKIKVRRIHSYTPLYGRKRENQRYESYQGANVLHF